MEIFYRNQINITIFVFLIFVWFIAFRKLDRKDQLNRSFLFTAIGIMLGLVAETVTDFLNGNSNYIVIILNNFFSVLLFIIAPIMSFNFFYFIFHIVFPGKKRNKVVWGILVVPIISNIIISILSPFFGLFFKINDLGVYSRGPLWVLSAFSTYIFVATGIAIVFFNYKRMLRKDFWLILGIGFIPAIGGIIQSLVYGILTMWSSAGVALLIGYLFLQDRMIRLDPLTGTWNRESFFNTYSRRIQLYPNTKFGAIYFDIDNLKMINDTYGHLEGDNAIKLVIDIVKDNLSNGGVICRLGGDEFIVLYECEEETKILAILEKIKSDFLIREDVLKKQYPLECSFSVALYNSDFTSLNAFLSKLDFMMYQEKFSKKSS